MTMRGWWLCVALTAALWPLAAARADTTADINTLSTVIAGQDHTTKVKPLMDRLAAVVENSKDAGEVKSAQLIAGRIAEYGKKELAIGKDLEWKSPPDAQNLYRILAAQFDGMGIGSEATDRLKDRDFLTAERAWESYQRLLASEKKLKDVPGARRSIKDPKFAQTNRLELETMQGIARSIQQSYPRTGAADFAKRLIGKYEMTV